MKETGAQAVERRRKARKRVMRTETMLRSAMKTLRRGSKPMRPTDNHKLLNCPTNSNSNRLLQQKQSGKGSRI
jgi:hypothetical protein